MFQSGQGFLSVWTTKYRGYLPRHPGRQAGAALLCTLLIACGSGGGGDPQDDPWASFTQQKLDWQACDPTVIGEGKGKNPVVQLGERAQCALMRAPLDYANPGLGELQVALLRVAAQQPQQRLGAILFNPGGPGIDGLDLAPIFGALWSSADPEDPLGKRLKSMSDRYDLIGFSPRGVGASSSLTCTSPELQVIQNHLTFDRSPENLKNAQYNARLLAQACRKNPLSKYIHTEATARDMDLVRELLGDARLNYIGYSYGTWLGSWYASLFPERVGRMLLDSSVDITAGFDETQRSQEMGKQRVIDEVMLPYVTRHPELFNLGSSAAVLRENLLALSSQLKSILFSSIDFAQSSAITENGLLMNAVVYLQAWRLQNSQADAEQMHAAIQAHTFTPSEAENLTATWMAHQVTDALFARHARSSVMALPRDAVNEFVRCNDLGGSGTEQYWIDIGNEDAARYPFSGGGSTYKTCLYWGAAVKPRPSLAAARTAGPLLMLQNRYDALTPWETARASLEALPNASMVVVENEYSHGVFPSGQACVDEKVVDYFLYGSMPARLSSCAGKPLPADAGQPRQARAPALPGQGVMTGAAMGAYKDAAQAQDMMNRIHRQIDKAGRAF